MAENSDPEEARIVPLVGSDTRLHEMLFSIVQEAQAAGSVVQIITIWPAEEGSKPGGPIHPTKCAPTGACPK